MNKTYLIIAAISFILYLILAVIIYVRKTKQKQISSISLTNPIFLGNIKTMQKTLIKTVLRS